MLCLFSSCNAQSTAYTLRDKPLFTDTLIQITPLQGRGIIKTYDDLQAAKRLQVAYQKALDDCQLNEMNLAQGHYEQQQALEFTVKKLRRANLEKWAWRVSAVALLFLNLAPK